MSSGQRAIPGAERKCVQAAEVVRDVERHVELTVRADAQLLQLGLFRREAIAGHTAAFPGSPDQRHAGVSRKAGRFQDRVRQHGTLRRHHADASAGGLSDFGTGCFAYGSA